MSETRLLDRISVDPAVCGVLGFLADRMSAEDILADYPQLDADDIRARIAYGAALADARFD